jgi:hypothetical protein
MTTPTRVALSLVAATSLAAALAAHAQAPAAAMVDVPAAARAKMTVCTDGKAHYIAIGPHERVSHQLYYGDGKTMTVVGVDPSGMVPGHDFQDPRFPNPTANPSFRGIDWRNYSSVEHDAEKKTCALRCGEKTLPLTIVAADEAQKLVSAAKFVASPRTREPYALARDERGTYYYVDRGATPDTKQSFRVYVGRKGALKLQKMKDIASDSDGEVFSTAKGDLRLVTTNSTGKPAWHQGKQRLELLSLPVSDNLPLIYSTLGVYAGQRLGTPCDDQ